MIPSPSFAVLLLFPTSAKYYEYCEKLEELSRTEKQDIEKDVFFMKQTVRNACGTVALIHAVANSMEHLNLSPDSPVRKFVEDTKEQDPDQRALIFSQSEAISSAHEASAQEGQTE
ncbi:Ubiquitin carboxyl-terminal hydrolase isozyme L3, partial [Stegodyphus mimosarum]